MHQRLITEFIKSKEPNEEPNMATLIVKPDLWNHINPKIYDGSQELEEFIKEFKRFSELVDLDKAQEEKVVCFYLSKDMLEKYERSKGGSFEERLRKMMGTKRNIVDIMREAINTKFSDGDPDAIFAKLDKLIEEISSKKIGKKELSKALYENAIDDVDVKKEISLRNIDSIEEVKVIVKKMNEIKKNDPIMMIQPKTIKKQDWQVVTKKNHQFNQSNRNLKNKQPEFSHKKQATVVCYACGDNGHIRRDCPNVKCSYCNKKGHLRTQCYQNKNRFNERLQMRGRMFRRYPIQTMSGDILNETKETNNNNPLCHNYVDYFRQQKPSSDNQKWNEVIQEDSNSENGVARSMGEVINVLN